MRTRDLFTTVRTEGGLLPADLLQRIAAGDSDLEGLKPSDYHLAGTERLNEAISRAWNRLLGAWTAFRAAAEKLPQGDLGTSPTRERWLLILFQELGYGRLSAARAVDIEGKAYPISHFWQNSPIHLVGFRVDLDRRTRGVTGAARTSPHSLLQEFLNRSDDHLWGFVSNGLRLRILRDNVSLTRQSYVEFDLEGMMDGEAYADFALLWLLCHQSRVEGERPEQCWLERWVRIAQQQGTRALEHLRDGVTKAIKSLGSGFLAHPHNTGLREKLRSGQLDKQDYFRQLLRLVYRMIFLFAAEDRGLLLDPNADPVARRRYQRFYSTARLRRLAEKRRGTKHADLHQGLYVVMERLGSDAGCPELALPALGSFLWSDQAIPDLTGADIANHDLLDAVRALAFTVEEKVFRVIDYKSMGAEELGSVYESLLEMHPELNAEAAAFDLKVAPGHERKTTGSYYTPASLVNCLLDSALDPVVDARLKEASRMANGEWRVVSSELTDEEKRYVYRVLSGSASLAAGQASGQSSLRTDGGLSSRGTFRTCQPDSAGGDLDTSEHRRGMGQALSGGVHPVSASGQRQPDGTRDTPDYLGGPGLSRSKCGRTDSEADGSPRQATPDAGAHPPEASKGLTPFAAHRSPIAMDRLWRKSPLAIRYSLLAERALLALKICDPACGSGHFLLSAAHRIAKRLAAIRAGEEEPAPESIAQALRDVIGHCIYGVDINPMAVELCKVSLWMEAMEPGKPLTFLDHHIKCGNSLLGATPALLKKGIPDEAFKPITGDDKAYCRELKKQNKSERKYLAQGQGALFYPWERLGDLATAMVDLDEMPDDTPQAVRAKQERYERLVKSNGYLFGHLWADAWCAAFVWHKVPERDGGPPYGITEEIFRAIEKSPHSVPQWMKDEIQRLAREYQFFHWHLEFPDVFRPANSERRMANGEEKPLTTRHSPLAPNPQGWLGGFDCVLGNPPWGADIPKSSTSLIRYRYSGSQKGTIDTFALFTELFALTTRINGTFGLVLPDILLLKNYPGIRLFLLDHAAIVEIAHWGHAFDQVNIDVCSLVAIHSEPGVDHKIRCIPEVVDKQPRASRTVIISQSTFRQTKQYRFNLLLSPELQSLIGAARSLGPPMSELFILREGVHSGNVRSKLFLDKPEGNHCERLIFGRDEISPMLLTWAGRYIQLDPNAFNREAGEYFNLGDPNLHRSPKLLVRRTGDYLLAAVDNKGFFCSNNFFLCVPRPGVAWEKVLYVCAVLNSRFATWFFRAIQPRTGKLFAELKITHLEDIPIPFVNDPWAANVGKSIEGWFSEHVTIPDALSRFNNDLESRIGRTHSKLAVALRGAE